MFVSHTMPSWATYNIIDNIFWVLLKSTEIILLIPVVFSFSSSLVLFSGLSIFAHGISEELNQIRKSPDFYTSNIAILMTNQQQINFLPRGKIFPFLFYIWLLARRKAEIIKLSVVVAFAAFTACQWLVTIKQWAYFPATALVFPFPSETFSAFHQKKYTYSATHWDDHCQVWTI